SGTALAGLLDIADRQVTAAEASKKVYQSLNVRYAAAKRDLQTLQQLKAQSSERLQRWQEDWSARLAEAGLPIDLGVQAATLALEAYSQLSTALDEIRDLQINRIDAMRGDLNELETLARKLSTLVDAMAKVAAPEEVSSALSLRLKHARTAQELRRQLVKSAEDYRDKKHQAMIQRDAAVARLTPLFDRS